jgi:hypothetical protein
MISSLPNFRQIYTRILNQVNALYQISKLLNLPKRNTAESQIAGIAILRPETKPRSIN